MLKGGLTLCDAHVSVQEDRGCTTNHGTVYRAHDRYAQMMHINIALIGTRRGGDE